MQIESTLPIVMKADAVQPVQRTELSEPVRKHVPEHIDLVISDLGHAMQPFDIALKFSKDSETGAIVIEMINQVTGETLQQIPNEALLHVSAVLGKLQGKIFDKVA